MFKINQRLRKKKPGKLIYIGFSEYKSLEKIGKKYISKPLLENGRFKKVSYNKSIKFLLSLVDVAEKIDLPKDDLEREEDD